MQEGIITLIAFGYCVFSYCRKKNIATLLLSAILICIQLTQWPLYLPFNLSEGLLAAIASVFCFCDFYKKKYNQFLIYGFIFLFFAILRIVEPYVHKAL